MPAHLSLAPASLSPEAAAVRDALIARGLETPLVPVHHGAEEKRARIEASFTEILTTLGLDLTDDSLVDTPRRIAKMYVDEIFGGLDYRSFPKLTVVANKMACDEMIRVDGVSVSSTCEHHFVTIDGTATVAYIPKDKVIGLSKINRVVAFFAQRPQIQERLTEQVLLALQTLLGTDDVAVSITAVHFCVRARGVMDSNSKATTTALGGAFKLSPETRKEFLVGLGRAAA
ncbi:MAG TPA: GTP cyclohydrolase I FolE [Gammaproteobacteria bacterium]